LTLSHRFFDERTEVLKPSIRFFTTLDNLSQKDIEARRNQIKYDQPVSIARTFKGERVAFMSLRCDGIYDEDASGNIRYDEGASVAPGVPGTYLEAVQEMWRLVDRMQEEQYAERSDL